MTSWMTNAVMTWNGNMITDHGRQTLTEKIERFGTDKRMANGTLRRFYVGIKRSWDVNWQNIPSTNTVSTGYKTADGGYAGEDIEAFYRANQGKFRLVLRRGSALGVTTPTVADSACPYQDQNFYITNVMFTDFSKDVIKRGKVDFWNITCTLEEI